MESYKLSFLIIITVAVLWELFWKGYALWTASKLGHKRWFVALMVLNTLGIIQIFYIFYVAKKTSTDIKKLFKTKL